MPDSGTKSLKRTMLRLLALPGPVDALARLTQTDATIFMLHRFSVPDHGINGHNPVALRRNLEFLRKRRYELMPLHELFSRLREGMPLKRAVAFTIDDGYFDHAQVAAPIFMEFDCPVTCFVTTGFLDRTVWFWWDRLKYIFEESGRAELRARVGVREFRYRRDSKDAILRSWWDLNLRCQDASDEDRLACISELSREAEVELPVLPPPRFAPMSWTEVRMLERKGVSFGPHTVTHPVLGTTSPAQAQWEIVESWSRLSAEVEKPVPVFCYPNGRSQDVGEREMSTVRGLGLWGALMAESGPMSFYRFPRSGYTDDLCDLLQCLSGLQKLKTVLRRRFRK